MKRIPRPPSPNPFAARALGADSLWLGSVWPQPDTQHCEPLGKSCSLAGRHTAPTVSVERHSPGFHSGSVSLLKPGCPFSNCPGSWPPPRPPIRMCRFSTIPPWGSPLTQRTICKLQCAWHPLGWAVYTPHTSPPEEGWGTEGRTGTEEEWNSFWAFVPNFS